MEFLYGLAALLGGVSLAAVLLSVYFGVRRNGERLDEILDRISDVEGGSGEASDN